MYVEIMEPSRKLKEMQTLISSVRQLLQLGVCLVLVVRWVVKRGEMPGLYVLACVSGLSGEAPLRPLFLLSLSRAVCSCPPLCSISICSLCSLQHSPKGKISIAQSLSNKSTAEFSAVSAGIVPWIPSNAHPTLRAFLWFFYCFGVCCCPVALISKDHFHLLGDITTFCGIFCSWPPLVAAEKEYTSVCLWKAGKSNCFGKDRCHLWWWRGGTRKMATMWRWATETHT